MSPLQSSLADKLTALMRCWLLVCALSVCSGVRPADQNPYSWNAGRYRFAGFLSYSNDSQSGERTERRQVGGRVVVDPSGPASMESEDGPCGTPEAKVLQADERRGTRSFQCGDALFTFHRRRVDIGVTMRADVLETTRRRGGCAEYQYLADGRRVCARYDYVVSSAWVSRAATITTVIRDRP